MKIVGLTPTYRRRELLSNLLACFDLQTWKNGHLLICDDSGELRSSRQDNWEVLATSPFGTLPEKYNFMAEYAFEQLKADAVAVMEDDDVYFPDYLNNHLRALAFQNRGWSHLGEVWVDGSGGGPAKELFLEKTGHGRFHGCLAMTPSTWEAVGGWPKTPRMDFDLQLLSRLRQYGPPADPCWLGPSQYYFRWGSTQSPHGEAYSDGPGDSDWLRKAQHSINRMKGAVVPNQTITSKFDSETSRLVMSWKAWKPTR